VSTLRRRLRSFAFGLVVVFAFGRWSFWPSGNIFLVARRAFTTGEFIVSFGGSPGLLLQVKFHDG